jgi:hypothetical protein
MFLNLTRIAEKILDDSVLINKSMNGKTGKRYNVLPMVKYMPELASSRAI